jgi:hypothetical protein
MAAAAYFDSILGKGMTAYERLQAARSPAAAAPSPPVAAKLTAAQAAAKEEELANEEDNEVSASDEIDTFADYQPAKVTIGRPHPDPVVETSSMSSIKPPDPACPLALPREIIQTGLLSSLQLESIVYASMRHQVMPSSSRLVSRLISMPSSRCATRSACPTARPPASCSATARASARAGRSPGSASRTTSAAAAR